MPLPSVDPRPPEADESRFVVPLEAQEASYLAASDRTANRSFSDFFISTFTKCSRYQSQDIDKWRGLESLMIYGGALTEFQIS